MKEQMRILIGYDGSSCADAALDDLRRAGLPRNAEVLMLAVNEVWLPAVSNNEPSGPRESSSSNSSIRESRPPQTPVATAVAPVSEVGALTLAAKGRLQNRFSAWTINVEESSGSPAYELLKRAEELKSHLIVVGCHGRSELGGFLLGSISQKVVNEARCTVRVSRGTAWKDGSPVRIVIGMDELLVLSLRFVQLLLVCGQPQAPCASLQLSIPLTPQSKSHFEKRIQRRRPR